MAKTPLNSHLRKALRLAKTAQDRGWSDCRLKEFLHELESRRGFLKKAAAFSLAPLIGAPERRAAVFRRTLASSKSERVLILGGGAAGLAAAHALNSAGVPFLLAEADSERLGGRIFTRIHNKQNQFIEVGAEFVDADHSTLLSLAASFGLEIQSVHAAHVNPEAYWIGGHAYRFNDLVAGVRPYLRQIHEAIDVGGADFLTFDGYRRNPAAAKYDTLSAAEFLESMNGKVEPWILKLMGMQNVAEFGTDLEEMSAINLIFDAGVQVADYSKLPEEIECARVRGGNSSLIESLAEALPRENIMMGCEAIAIRRHGSSLRVIFRRDQGTLAVDAAQVITTVPFPVLRSIEGIANLDLSAEKMDCIRHIGSGSNSKIALEFTKKPWLKNGRVPASAGLLYTDAPSLSFWEATRGQSGTNGILMNYTGGRVGASVDEKTATSLSMPDLCAVYPELASDLVSDYSVNWLRAPAALGSYACMRVGQFQRFNGVQGTTELEGRLLFAGEATDQEYAGYMEGAYRTGLASANEILRSRGLPEFVLKGAKFSEAA